MMIRSGKNVGQINYALTDVVGEKNDILLQFISNYYSSGANMLPKEIIVKDFDEEQKEMLQGYFLSNFNRVVKVTVPKIGLKVDLLENSFKNAKEYLLHSKERIDKKYRMTTEALENLKNLLNLKRLNRIECYDISHISGTNSVASMIVFEAGEPAYKEYRKFKISTKIGNDDFASMIETLTRRLTDLKELKENFNKKPDLIVIDGGFGQLNAVQYVIENLGLDIPVISLAEKNEEICTLKSKQPIVLKKSDNTLKLLQRVRDEAHRFAITFHRQLRGKTLKSALSEIEGVGKVKVQALLKHFKSVESISKASEKDLMEVDGMGIENAKNIYNYFHKNIVS
jgi:excinuclease ABC subunit C